MSLIRLEGISRVYGSGPAAVHALRPTHLTFEEGMLVAIFGVSGSGKSTLLNMLGLLDEPTSGDYLLEGRNVAKLTDATRSVIRCKQIGIIFQSFNLFPHFSILENVCMPMRFAGVERHEMKARASELLNRVGLGDRLSHSPSQLSGGQCQRVAIARALANSPSVILADEPVASLDPITTVQVMDDFARINKDFGITIVANMHHVDLAIKYATRIIGIQDGRVVYDGPSRQIDDKTLVQIYGRSLKHDEVLGES